MIPLVLAVFLAVGQASSPLPPKASNKPTRASGVAQDHPSTNTPKQNRAVVESAPNERAIRVVSLPPRSTGDTVALVCTVVLSLVGISGIIVAICTLKIIGRQTTAIEEQTKALTNSERAWIHADFIRREIMGVTLYSLVITNQGKTPAQIFDYHIWHGLLTEGVPFAKEKLTTHFSEDSHIFIGGGQTETLRNDFRLEDLFILEDSKPAASAGFPQGAFCITVNYGDVVTEKAKRKEHRTSFVYLVNLTFSTLTRIAQYNDYT